MNFSPSSVRTALAACHGMWQHASRLALDIALPTPCVACREPVDGEGVCAECWSKLSFIERPYCPRLGIPFVYDPGPDMLSMEAIASPPAYQRARAAVRYDEVARTLVHALKYQDRTDLAPRHGPLDGARRQRDARRRRHADPGAAALAAGLAPPL
jgi:predicted amidophosphoribosyltransferase